MKLALAPLALVAGLALSACGSDDSSTEATDPADGTSSGSVETTAAGPFCEALMATATVQDGADVAALREGLEAAGIPEEAGPEAAAGLEVYIDVLAQVDEDATSQELAQLEDPGLTRAEQAEVDAMVGYATTTCTAGAGQSPSDVPEEPESEPESKSGE